MAHSRSGSAINPPHAEEARSAVSKHAAGFCRRILSAGVLFSLFAAAPAFAVNPGEQLADPAQEARARALGAELRCMVCQNQSIDDSDAPLAKDLRVLVRERVKAGDSDGEVLDFLVARYGEFVLLRPRLRGETLLLWGLAPAVLLLGLIGYFIWARRARRRPENAESLSESERARLESLLSTDGEQAGRRGV
ncbi:cytochrome c-type biogenesis protein CcmH [Chelatococcus sambhunathii]|uniref:Cytochrome c-type biogenesis protein n=1 Tax=Chelatococcus sambhunathii TaxID=363953 RepID=A0ABU1DK41_9HYPH|nr:cytochrome c-type biogenesis protein CcmH [Chelatococcus sambhunathii]